jgi:hypothetical protein
VEEPQVLRLGPSGFAQDDTRADRFGMALSLGFALCANDPTLATMKPSRRWDTRFVAGWGASQSIGSNLCVGHPQEALRVLRLF